MSRKVNGRNIERGIYINNGYVYVRLFINGQESKTYVGPLSEPGILDAATEKLHQIKKEIRAGKLGQEIKAVRWTVLKACEYYMDKEGDKLKGAGVKTYVSRIKEFMGHMFLDDVTFQTVQEFREWLEEEKECQSVNINRHHEYVTRLFNILKDWKRRKAITNIKLPEENPGALVKSAQEFSRTRVASFKEYEDLLANATPNVARILTMAMHTLLRCKDLRGLSLSQSVNWPINRIEGRQAKTANHGLTFSLPINPTIKQILESTEGDKVLDFTNFRQEFTIAKAKSGITDLMMTDIRRTGAYRLHKAGVPIAVVSKMLGHTSIEMTMRYLPTLDDDKDNAGETLERIFGKSSVVSIDQIKQAI